jgi:hypothetical protein
MFEELHMGNVVIVATELMLIFNECICSTWIYQVRVQWCTVACAASAVSISEMNPCSVQLVTKVS